MKPVLFRFKIAVISLLISGPLLVGFGVFFLVVIGRVGMSRVDNEIRALGEGQVQGQHRSAHWLSFDQSLRFIYGEEATRRVAMRVFDVDGEAIFTSQHWPAELTAVQVPPLAYLRTDYPLPENDPRDRSMMEDGVDFVRRLDRDGDGRVSVEEFDGRLEHFLDADRNGDGYISRLEAPRHPRGPDQAEEGGRRGPGRPEGRAPGFRGPETSPPHLPPQRKVPVFETHETSTSAWRMGFMGNEFVTLIVAADLATLHEEATFFRNVFLIVTPIAMVVLGLAGWVLASRALRPVAIITHTAETITARGLDRRVSAVTADAELGRLVGVINRMLDRLERSYHQAVRFSADAAHELQTPLTVLQGELDNAVQQAVAGSEEQQRYSDLLEEVRGLKAIVQKLLLLARADVGQLPLHLEQVDLSALLGTVVDDVEALAPHRTVETTIPPGLQVRVDADLFGQVVRNMISNAIKHGCADGTIRIELAARDGGVQLTFRNTAPPIPDEDRKKVFDRFFRVDKARSRATRGSGLGLSLAREIARAHGGDLVLNPYRDGMVSFVLTLPAA